MVLLGRATGGSIDAGALGVGSGVSVLKDLPVWWSGRFKREKDTLRGP